MDKNLNQRLTESAAEAVRIARGIAPEQLSAPTPCAEYDARALINHWVLYTSHGLEHRARREQLSEELQNRDFTADPAWADAYAAQLDRALAAWADPAVWEGEVDLGGASMPAPRILSLIVKELVVHGWDVARATGQEYRCTEETGELILAVVEEHAELYRQYKGFAEPVELPGTASAFDRALALSGRDPQWSV